MFPNDFRRIALAQGLLGQARGDRLARIVTRQPARMAEPALLHVAETGAPRSEERRAGEGGERGLSRWPGCDLPSQ